MLKRILKRASCYHYTFSSQMAPRVCIQDWQYVRQINESLKANNINLAFSTLIKSYLNNQILDIQTYHALSKKIQDNNMSLSYKQLLYKLYREQFHPHLLMVDLMINLCETKDKNIRDIIIADLNTLSVPLTPKILGKEPKDQLETPKQQRSTKEKKYLKPQKVVEIQKDPRIKMQQNLNLRVEKNEQKLSSSRTQMKYDDIEIQKLTSISGNHVQTLIQQFLANNGRVILHNIELSYGNQQSEDFTQQEDEALDFQNQNGGDAQYSANDQLHLEDILSFNKIKIGKIQLFKKD